MLELEFGVVRFFNPSESYGFLRVLDENYHPTSEDIFFHLYQGEWVEIIEDDIQFIGRHFGEQRQEINEPQAGNKLAFQRAEGAKGKMLASPWTYASAYINRMWQLYQPSLRIVRVITPKRGNASDSERVIWEGRDVEEMSRLFPIQIINGQVNDPLYEEDDEQCTVRFRFDLWTWRDDASPDPFYDNLGTHGHWREYYDPRPRSPEVLEKEADFRRRGGYLG